MIKPQQTFIYLFIYRFVQCTGERTIGHVVPYLVEKPTPYPKKLELNINNIL